MGRITTLLLLLLACGCKTTQNADSSLEAWATPEAKAQAVRDITQALLTCVPQVTAASKGGPVTMATPTARSLAAAFATSLVAADTPQTESAAKLLRTAYLERPGLANCRGEAAEYVVGEFVVQTNLFEVLAKSASELKFLGKAPG